MLQIMFNSGRVTTISATISNRIMKAGDWRRRRAGQPGRAARVSDSMRDSHLVLMRLIALPLIPRISRFPNWKSPLQLARIRSRDRAEERIREETAVAKWRDKVYSHFLKPPDSASTASLSFSKETLSRVVLSKLNPCWRRIQSCSNSASYHSYSCPRNSWT